RSPARRRFSKRPLDIFGVTAYFESGILEYSGGRPREDRDRSTVPDRATFQGAYAGKAPWDIGKPQGAFVAVADRVASPVLDAGCGTGENALFFAALGHRVTGIDFVDEAVRRARAKAAQRGLTAEFLVKDATALGGWSERFASVIDCGLFHVFS